MQRRCAALNKFSSLSKSIKQLGAKAKVESQRSTILADGKTFAAEAVLSAKLAAYDMYLYCLGTNLGGKTIAVVAYTLRSSSDNKALVREIASTLAVK